MISLLILLFFPITSITRNDYFPCRLRTLFLNKVKEKIVGYGSLSLSKKSSFIFMLVFTAVVVFDSTVVDFSSYSGVEASIPMNTAIFVVFSIIFAASSTMLLYSVKGSKYTSKSGPLNLRYFHLFISGTVISTVIVILIIIFQMVLLNEYILVLLNIQTYLSHLSGLVFLSLLVFLFGRWFTSKKSYPVILYTISLSLLSINLVVSLIYLEYYLYGPSPMVKPYSINSFVVNFNGVTNPAVISGNAELLSTLFDILSLSSFLLMWIATAILLRQYRYKMGRTKYFTLMSIPLLYYIFPFQNYFGDSFLTLLQSSPVFFSILYVLIFSATKQVGALVFGLAFWTASSLVHDERIRKSLLTSSVGIVIVFGSVQIESLQYHVYPPYGLVTEAFIPVGAYLLFVGIFSSARHISRDAQVRKEFYKSASSQLTLLQTIGVSQMEKAQVNSLEECFKPLETTDEPELNHEEIKKIIHDVLTELYYSKGKKAIQRS
jgi:hypothetical protein